MRDIHSHAIEARDRCLPCFHGWCEISFFTKSCDVCLSWVISYASSSRSNYKSKLFEANLFSDQIVFFVCFFFCEANTKFCYDLIKVLKCSQFLRTIFSIINLPFFPFVYFYIWASFG
jgi:hypothetical protein